MMRGLFEGRMICWFSCGAASAVAAKLMLTSEEYKNFDRQVVYCDTSADEHPDNLRFLSDCEKWYGVKIHRLKHPHYNSIHDVFHKRRFIVGRCLAPCSETLKQQVRLNYQLPGDLHVLGYTVEEIQRAERFQGNNQTIDCEFILINKGMTKEACFGVLAEAGIEQPMMYRMGYPNNNCIGCVKGGIGYWNRIRRDFPEVFNRMARLEREIGATVIHTENEGRIFLDELDPIRGQFEPFAECGAFCDFSLKEQSV